MAGAERLSLRRRGARAATRGRRNLLAVVRLSDHMDQGEAPAAPPASPAAALMARRFRGFLPVVVDVECGGFQPATDALLEIAAVIIEMNESGLLRRGPTHSCHVRPFEGARLDPAALAVTKIDPWHPLRPAVPEREALQRIFREVRLAVRANGCKRA